MFLWGAPSRLPVRIQVLGRLHGIRPVGLFYFRPSQLRQSDCLIPGAMAKREDCVVVREVTYVPLFVEALVTSVNIISYYTVLDGIVDGSRVV